MGAYTCNRSSLTFSLFLSSSMISRLRSASWSFRIQPASSTLYPVKDRTGICSACVHGSAGLFFSLMFPPCLYFLPSLLQQKLLSSPLIYKKLYKKKRSWKKTTTYIDYKSKAPYIPKFPLLISLYSFFCSRFLFRLTPCSLLTWPVGAMGTICGMLLCLCGLCGAIIGCANCAFGA